ncbi:MAG: HAD-IA family hydrolase [Anaerolineae bacterium]|nr:HAD-IA family hydrolase [Anaerolineae bacterium]
MPIKAICFDADGVLVYPQMQFAKLCENKLGISQEMRDPFFKGVFNECLVGKAELLDVLPPFLKKWNWSGSTEEFVALWQKTDHVIDTELITTIKKLRQNGFICCLATSQEQHRAEYMKKEMGFLEVFDHLFISCEMGTQKPGDAYYRYIETHLRLPGESILFWDDRPRNVNAAKARGWNAEVYTNYEQFLETLALYQPFK